jgi:GGDEF domain-containing protein
LAARKDDINPGDPWRRRSAHLETDQSASDLNQTASDADQTASDTDQSMADRDQAAAEADQRVSDSDQAVSDRELEVHPLVDPTVLRAHEQARIGRGEGTMSRMATTAVRAQVASERRERAEDRDEMALHRDKVAAARDREAEELDEAAEEMAGRLGKDSPAAKVAAVARASAAAARARAAEDRERAARDREDAARDRELLMSEIERSHIDEATGAYGRRIGEVVLRHEIERAQRMGGALALGVVVIDEVAEGEERSGDPALTRGLFLGLQSRLRPYDPIVRWGDNEFVCAIAEIAREDARGWLEDACSGVAERHPNASTGIGVAGLEGDDTLNSLINRARSSS